MRRAKILFAGKEVDFVDRDIAIRQIEELAEKGTYPVYVIYGPEGCGKTAFLRQAMEVLRDYDYSVTHVNPMARVIEDKLSMTSELRDLMKDVLNIIPTPFKDAASLIDTAIELLYMAIKRNIKRKIALLADDVFQAIGLDRAEQLVKGLLNMIEWPSVRYEKIIVLVTSSEGITKERIGRHRWATFRTMWNMGKEGFRQLYDLLPGNKPSFNDAWRWAGGNPGILEKLHRNNWNVDKVIEELIQEKGITPEFVGKWYTHLEKAVKDPDYLWWEPARDEEAGKLWRELVSRNLIVYFLPNRDQHFWIDAPPQEVDGELGIGRYVAWQTPLHREAVRKALKEVGQP